MSKSYKGCSSAVDACQADVIANINAIMEKKIKFMRNNQVITLDAKSSVKFDSEPVRLDPLTFSESCS